MRISSWSPRGAAVISDEIEKRRLAILSRQIPSDECDTIGGLKGDFLNADQACLLGLAPSAIGDVNEAAVKHPCADTDKSIGAG
jgi:hypothetical protein